MNEWKLNLYSHKCDPTKLSRKKNSQKVRQLVQNSVTMLYIDPFTSGNDWRFLTETNNIRLVMSKVTSSWVKNCSPKPQWTMSHNTYGISTSNNYSILSQTYRCRVVLTSGAALRFSSLSLSSILHTHCLALRSCNVQPHISAPLSLPLSLSDLDSAPFRGP